jgi:hypothetical protein
MAILSKQALKVENNASFPNNSIGAITATGLRDFNTDIIDSLVDEESFVPFSASVGTSIFNLNQFTSSQQPSFTALNAFTASQVTLNNGYRSDINTNTADITTLDGQYTTLANWSASINQIIFNNTVIGNAQRFAFGGPYVTASIVPNINGQVAVITVNHDGTKLNTSSFNDYSASVSEWSSSVNNTVSASANSVALLSSKTGSYATTGSNTFFGNQTINGDATITGSLTVGGVITAREIHTIIESSSVIFSSGSNQFGDELTDTQILSGSVQIVGTGTIDGKMIITGSLNPLNNASASLEAFSASQLTINSGYNAYTQSATIAFNSYTSSTNGRVDALEDKSGSYAITGSNRFTGSQTITGSVYGNVTDLIVTNSTASIDLSNSNFYSLSVATASVRLEATNVLPGQTVNILVTQDYLSGSLTFSNEFKWPAGFAYSASYATGSEDILTFVTFNSAKVYSAGIKNLT